uniref:Uncharacterized protein n=1 Tax=Rhizophora mucronata TaxID=61149 RepID=A0A2P2ITT4_RHIMU
MIIFRSLSAFDTMYFCFYVKMVHKLGVLCCLVWIEEKQILQEFV